MIRKIYIVLICCSLFATNGLAQNIRGRVTDAISRQPLENVSVSMPENNGKGTVTDQYGNFSLPVNNSKAILVFSYVGYAPLSLQATTDTTLHIAMQPDAVNLKDVVVLTNNHFSKFSTLAKIDLAVKPVRNTQELLRLVPGLFIAQHAGGGKAEQIFLRGFDCDHGTDVQVSVDGLPVNMVSHAHGQGYADSHFIIPETINNIDFGAGPYYTGHGNLNTAGYVAFSTYNNIPNSRIQLEAGRYHTFRTLAILDLIKHNKDRQSAYLAGDFYYTDGPTQHKQSFNRFNIFGKYNLAIGAATQLTATLSSFKSKWDASGQIPERAVATGLIGRFGSIDPTEGGNTERHNINLSLAHRFNNGNKWENQVYYSRYKFNLYSNFSFFLNDPVNGDEINQAEDRGLFGYSSTLKREAQFGNLGLTSTWAAGIRYDATHNSRLDHVVKRQFLEHFKLGDIREANAWAYAQEQFHFGKWLIDAGLRYDYFHFAYNDKLTSTQLPAQSKGILSPKLNIQYTANPRLQLYVKTGKGFHSNDTRVVVANAGKDILPAAYGIDAGFIYKPSPALLLNIAAWYLHLDQEFVYVGDDGNVEPSGRTKRQGIDLVARYQFSKNLYANLNLNYTKPRSLDADKGNDYIPLAPVFTSIGGIFYKPKEGFNGGINYRYIKSRPANEDNSVTAKGYFIVDATINYTKPRYEIGLAVENLFNSKWNEAQFATESRLKNEAAPVTELNYTPGTPFFARLKLAVFF